MTLKKIFLLGVFVNAILLVVAVAVGVPWYASVNLYFTIAFVVALLVANFDED